MPVDYVKRPTINYAKQPERGTPWVATDWPLMDGDPQLALLATIQGGAMYRIWQLAHGPVVVTVMPEGPYRIVRERIAFDGTMAYPKALRAIAWAITCL